MSITFKLDKPWNNGLSRYTFRDEKESYVQLEAFIADKGPITFSVRGPFLNSHKRFLYLEDNLITDDNCHHPSDPQKVDSICRVLLEKINKNEIELTNDQDIKTYQELSKTYISFQDCDKLFAPLIPNSPFVNWIDSGSKIKRLAAFVLLAIEMPLRYLATLALDIGNSCYFLNNVDKKTYWHFRLTINQNTPLHCLINIFQRTVLP